MKTNDKDNIDLFSILFGSNSSIEDSLKRIIENKEYVTTSTFDKFTVNKDFNITEDNKIVKTHKPIKTNNFSVFLSFFNGKTEDPSLFEYFNIVEFDYDENRRVIGLIIEDSVDSDEPLQLVLEYIKNNLRYGRHLELTVDLFDECSELTRSYVFKELTLVDYHHINSFNIKDNTNNNLKYKVNFSFENFQIL